MPKQRHTPRQRNLLRRILALPLLAIGTLYLYWHTTAPRYETIEDLNTLTIATPSLQKQEVRKIQLPNGLHIVVISDPEADQSAASISIGVGSWHDPPHRPGMAHFCEHLLFLGTKTYPQENLFSTSVQDHGGTDNAYTAANRTVYAFCSNHSAFKALLHQFAHFFIDPTFNPSTVARELQAVDQENDMYVQNDLRRYWMVLKATGNPNHPNALFSTGNAQTLQNIPVEEVQQWYEAHYSPHQARLVIYTQEPMHKIIPVVVDYFSQIPSRKHTPKQPYQGTILSHQQKGHITYVEPIQDIRELTLTWELPDAYTLTDHKVADLIAYAINSQAENSLYSQLKQDNIAENITASPYRLGDRLLFSITITFLKNDPSLPIDQAITRCFQCIAGLRASGIPPYIFEEIRQQAQTEYMYQQRTHPFNLVMQGASELLDEPTTTYPLQTVLPSHYQASACNNMLQALTPQACVFSVLAPATKTGVTYDQEEPWYKVPYTASPIPAEKLDTWKHIPPHPKIGLPPPNPFIPTDFTLQHTPQHAQPTTPHPTCLEDTPQGKAFFYADDRYGTPTTVWWFQIKSPLINHDPKQTVLTKLYLKTLAESLSHHRREASRGGLHSHLWQEDQAFHILIEGYHHKAPLLLDTILTHATHNLPSKEQFEKHRNALSVWYTNQIQSATPSTQALYMYSDICHGTPTYEACLDALSNISYETFCTFSQALFEKAYVQALFTGNVHQQEALDTFHKVQATLVKTPYPTQQHPTQKLFVLGEGTGPYKMVQRTSMQGYGAYVLLQVGDFSFPKQAAMDILGSAWESDYYDALRTKQQIAYSLSTLAYARAGQLMHSFHIESSTYDIDELLIRTNAFIEAYSQNLQAHIPEERFEKIRQELIEKLQIPPRNLYAMSGRLHKLAFTYDEDFDRIDQQIEALQKMTYEAFQSYVQQCIAHRKKQRIAFLVKGTPSQGKDFAYKHTDSDRIHHQGTYVQKPTPPKTAYKPHVKSPS